MVSKIAVPVNKNLRYDTRYTRFDKDIALIKLRDKVSSTVQRIALHSHWNRGQMMSCKVAGNIACSGSVSKLTLG